MNNNFVEAREELVVITGPMFAAKTSALISSAKQCIENNLKVAALKPVIDVRYVKEDICSHDGISFRNETNAPVVVVKDYSEYEMHNLFRELNVDVCIIDEAQFFPKLGTIIKNYIEMPHKKTTFICAGLDMDSSGRPFDDMPSLLSFATMVIKLHADCSVCKQNNATRTFRKLNTPKGTIAIGGSEMYEARCLSHWSIGEEEKRQFLIGNSQK